MKFLVLLMLFSSLANAECYRGDVKSGGITGLEIDATLFFDWAGNAGGQGAVVARDKRGRLIYGEVQCFGGAPDECRIGTDGAIRKFQFIDNRPTIVLHLGKLAAIGGDGDEQDLSAVEDGKDFNYPMEIVDDQKICANLFPQEREPLREPSRPYDPSVNASAGH